MSQESKLENNSISSAKSGLIGGVFWSVIRSWGTRVATVLVFFILTRLLNPEEIGLISYILGWLALLSVMADLGLAEYVVYNHHSPRSTELGIWWFQVGVSLLLTLGLVLLLCLGLVNPDSKSPHGVWAMIVLSLTLPISAAAKIPEALLRRAMDYKGLAIRSLVAISISSAIAVVLALCGYGVWSLVAKQLIEVIIDAFYCFKLSAWRPSLELHTQSLLSALRGGWGIVSSRLLDVLAQTADTLIIGSMFGMRDLGFYSMAKKVFQVLNDGVVQSVTGVVASAYGRVKADPHRLKSLYLVSIKFVTLVTVPVFVIAIALAQEWIPIVFGAKWASSSQITQVLCVTGIMAGFGSLNGFLVLANNRNKDFFTLMLSNTVLSLFLLFVLSQHGMLAAASTGPIKTLLMLPVGLYFAKKVIDFSLAEYFSALKPAALLSIYVAAIWAGLTEVVLLTHMPEPAAAIFKASLIVLVVLITIRVFYWQALKSLRLELRTQL